MSLDKLAVIFIIIILPISIVLSAYTNAQTETLKVQLSYDAKLDSATTDAIKAYQLNAFNETTSNLASMKMEEIDAAANAFLNSVATNFNMTGYSKEDIEDYVPALVFTMYDGYYIYSRYINTLTDEDYTTGNGTTIKASTYTNGQTLEGLKPFISYSCRYIKGSDDFVISYTLDNFISIQGRINNNWVNDSGYVIDPSKVVVNDDNSIVTYRGIEIGPEDLNTLKEKVGNEEYVYHNSNGEKYYYDPSNLDSRNNPDPKWFTILNGTKNYKSNRFDTEKDYSAYNYYKEAKEFTNRLISDYKLGDLTTSNMIDADNNPLDLNNNIKIFDTSGIEENNSNFNEHRLAVIKYTIEKNLSIAIANYNNGYSPDVDSNFLMPKLNETEWDKILNNMTLISFFQGLPIGGKVYNGCSVVANNKNTEVVSEESIYLTIGENYYKSTYTNFQNLINELGEEPIGIFNVDLERRSIEYDSEKPDYYYPKGYYADYDSVISPTKNANIYAEVTDASKNMYAYNGNIYKYMDKLAENANTKPVAKAYYTALARERYGRYKVARRYNIGGKIVSYNVPIGSDIELFECNNHTYKLFNDEKTWEQAAAYCESLGGHLITINSENELNEFEEKFGDETVWLGLRNDNEFYTGELYYNGNNVLPAVEVCNANSNFIRYNATDKHIFICEWD